MSRIAQRSNFAATNTQPSSISNTISQHDCNLKKASLRNKANKLANQFKSIANMYHQAQSPLEKREAMAKADALLGSESAVTLFKEIDDFVKDIASGKKSLPTTKPEQTQIEAAFDVINPAIKKLLQSQMAYDITTDGGPGQKILWAANLDESQHVKWKATVLPEPTPATSF